MADKLKGPKLVSPEQADFLRKERPVNTYGYCEGKERYKFADKLPTTPRTAVEKWDWLLTATERHGSWLLTYIEAHRPETEKGLQDADLYCYVYPVDSGEGGRAYHLTHPRYEGRSVALTTAPSSGLCASALAQMMGLSPVSGGMGSLVEQNLRGLEHLRNIVVSVVGERGATNKP